MRLSELAHGRVSTIEVEADGAGSADGLNGVPLRIFQPAKRRGLTRQSS